MDNSTTIGIDLAKNVFELVAVRNRSSVLFRRRIRRSQLLRELAQLAPCRVVMEACGGAHYWAREFRRLGHQVELIAPQHVKPYRQGQKNDRNDALAIVEASFRARLRTVAIKSEDQQALLSLQAVRRRLVDQRTGLINQTRGLLAEFGTVLPRGASVVRRRLPTIIDTLPAKLSELMWMQYEELVALDGRIRELDRRLWVEAKSDETCVRLMRRPGIGPVTAVLLLGHLGHGGAYRSGRAFSANLGLVPRQDSSGDQVRLGRMTRCGNRQLKNALIHGARSVLRHLGDKDDAFSRWARAVRDRRGFNKAVVAVANKMARHAWAEAASAA